MPALPPITFAVPYYRGPEYLGRAVRSVFAQSSPDWRLVVCDDGRDRTAETVLARHPDPRVRYLANDHRLGMAGNWNRGLDAAETDLVTLLHADDELDPGYAAAVGRAALRYPNAAGLFCRARVIGPAGQPVFSLPDRVKTFFGPPAGRPVVLRGPAGVAALLRCNFVMCPTVCYRRSVLAGRRFDDRWRFVLDLDFFTRLLKRGDTLVGVPDVAYAYRRHPGSATAEYTESLLRFREEVALYDELAAEAGVQGWGGVRRAARGKWMIRLHLAVRALDDTARGRFAAARAKLGYLLATGAGR